MRAIGLFLACSALAACGSGGEDSASVANAPATNGAVEAGDASMNEIAEPAGEIGNVVNEAEAQAAPSHPCQVQGKDRLTVAPIRAVGTEPFWNARVEGRCVTYSHPDDQQGTRIWTQYKAGPNGSASWVGNLDGQRFELRIRPEAGCSDGMSDERYPMVAELSVKGEQRRGCALPL